MLDCDILTFEVTGLAQPLAKRGKAGARFRRRPRAQEPDDRHPLLLRVRRNRPRCRRAAEQCDEFAPLHLPSTSPDYANLGVKFRLSKQETATSGMGLNGSVLRCGKPEPPLSQWGQTRSSGRRRDTSA